MQRICAMSSSSRSNLNNFFATASRMLLLSCMAMPALAADWQASNVQLLHGTNYEDLGGAIDDKEKTVFTFEHANGWAYGDNFFFLDVSNPSAIGTGYYAEFSPRFSIGKIAGADLSAGIIKDVMVAMTWEMAQGSHAILYGVGLPLNLPGFAFADINFYARDSTHDIFGDSQSGYQVTLDWLYPFALGSAKFAFEGFFDYAFGEDGGANPKKDNIVAAPRLLIGIGGGLQAGVEYQIWRNKFGINGADEDVAQIMLKWTM